MAQPKIDSFEKDEAWLASLAKALGHPARIKILHVLAEMNSCVCGDIVDRLPLSQSTVSQHLRELKRVGLIDGEVDGPKVCYCINQATMTRAQQAFTKLFSNVCQCGC